MTPSHHLAKEQFLAAHPRPTELDVPCSTCHAPPDHACLLRRPTPTGSPIHNARVNAWLRADARWWRALGDALHRTTTEARS